MTQQSCSIDWATKGWTGIGRWTIIGRPDLSYSAILWVVRRSTPHIEHGAMVACRRTSPCSCRVRPSISYKNRERTSHPQKWYVFAGAIVVLEGNIFG
jgi:hypothetical protein